MICIPKGWATSIFGSRRVITFKFFMMHTKHIFCILFNNQQHVYVLPTFSTNFFPLSHIYLNRFVNVSVSLNPIHKTNQSDRFKEFYLVSWIIGCSQGFLKKIAMLF